MKYLAAAIIVLFSCTNRHLEEDIPEATISFIKPSAGDTFHVGDTVQIKAIASSTEPIHGYDLLIRKSGETQNLDFVHMHDHSNPITIEYKWKNTVSGPANLEAEITLTLDHAGHTKTEKTVFSTQ